MYVQNQKLSKSLMVQFLLREIPQDQQQLQWKRKVKQQKFLSGMIQNTVHYVSTKRVNVYI